MAIIATGGTPLQKAATKRFYLLLLSPPDAAGNKFLSLVFSSSSRRILLHKTYGLRFVYVHILNTPQKKLFTFYLCSVSVVSSTGFSTTLAFIPKTAVPKLKKSHIKQVTS